MNDVAGNKADTAAYLTPQSCLPVSGVREHGARRYLFRLRIGETKQRMREGLIAATNNVASIQTVPRNQLPPRGPGAAWRTTGA